MLASLCLLVSACGQKESTQEGSRIQHNGDTITVPDNSSVLGQIVVQKTQLREFSSEFRTVGTVRPVSGKLAEIVPPFAGRIVKSFVRLGQKINAGTPVFELGSSEFYEATKSYFSAQSANGIAQINYNRQKELAANGVASQKELEQAKNEALIANQEFEQAQATLNIFNIDVSSLQMGQPLKVISPISGEVVQNNITIGSYVKEDSEALAVVADLSEVWVVARVKEKYFGAIKQGDQVEVFVDAQPNKTIWGTIYYIGEMLDEETRSLDVIVRCNNTDKDLKLGMFCVVHFLSSPKESIILPSTVIMKEEDRDYVLIELSKGKYLRRYIESESVNVEETRILSGLREGETVVVKGGIYLNL